PQPAPRPRRGRVGGEGAGHHRPVYLGCHPLPHHGAGGDEPAGDGRLPGRPDRAGPPVPRGGPAARAGWEGSGRGLSGRPGSDPPLLPGPGPLDSSPVLRGPERAPARGRVIGEVSTWRRVTRGRMEACRPDPT